MGRTRDLPAFYREVRRAVAFFLFRVAVALRSEALLAPARTFDRDPDLAAFAVLCAPALRIFNTSSAEMIPATRRPRRTITR